jgi:drug/metabolite transporter (DMT)-like permease
VTTGQIRPNDVADDLFEGEELIEDSTSNSKRYVTKSSPIGIISVLLGVVCLVAANVLGTQFGRSGLWITMWRSYIGVAILAVLVLVRRQNITIESLKYCFIPAIAFTIHIVCFYQAIQETTLTNVVIIRSLQPALTLFFVGAHFGEKVKRANVIAALVGFVGVALTVWGSTQTGNNSLFGDVLAVSALGAWIALFVTAKKARQHVGTASFMLITTSMAAIVTTLILPFTGEGLIPTSPELLKLVGNRSDRNAGTHVHQLVASLYEALDNVASHTSHPCWIHHLRGHLL